MYIILWEYYVKPDKQNEFKDAYSPSGAWAELFKKGNGYAGTELIRSPENLTHYITIDRWASQDAYEAFLSHWLAEYKELDLHCEDLTQHESSLGRFEALS